MATDDFNAGNGANAERRPSGAPQARRRASKSIPPRSTDNERTHVIPPVQQPQQIMNARDADPSARTRVMPTVQQPQPNLNARDADPSARTRVIPTVQQPQQNINARADTPAERTRIIPAAQQHAVNARADIPARRTTGEQQGAARRPAAQNGASAQQRSVRPRAERTVPSAGGTKVMAQPQAQPKTGDKQPAAKKHRSGGDNTLISLIFAILYIIFIAVASIFLAANIIDIGNDMFAFVKDDTAVEVTIPEYATLSEITEILYENGIIKHPKIFQLYSQMKINSAMKKNPDAYKDGAYSFDAGTYTVSPSMNYDQLRRAFHNYQEAVILSVTIPEGYTTDEIIDLFVSLGIGTREGFVDAISHVLDYKTDENGNTLYDADGNPIPLYDYWFLDELRENGVSPDRFYILDGYLYPDTYFYYSTSTESNVIRKMLDNFNVRYQKEWRERAAELGMTTDEVITLASLIEKEARFIADFSYVSSVFTNRLKHSSTFPYLESDATIMYAIQHNTGARETVLTSKDTSYPNPYNTYLYKGLPPGPIASPGYNAINYALYPANTNYYYFVSDSAGTIYYATTAAEQLANINIARGNS